MSGWLCKLSTKHILVHFYIQYVLFVKFDPAFTSSPDVQNRHKPGTKIQIHSGISDTAHLRRIDLTVKFTLQGCGGQFIAPGAKLEHCSVD